MNRWYIERWSDQAGASDRRPHPYRRAVLSSGELLQLLGSAVAVLAVARACAGVVMIALRLRLALSL